MYSTQYGSTRLKSFTVVLHCSTEQPIPSKPRSHHDANFQAYTGSAWAQSTWTLRWYRRWAALGVSTPPRPACLCACLCLPPANACNPLTTFKLLLFIRLLRLRILLFAATPHEMAFWTYYRHFKTKKYTVLVVPPFGPRGTHVSRRELKLVFRGVYTRDSSEFCHYLSCFEVSCFQDGGLATHFLPPNRHSWLKEARSFLGTSVHHSIWRYRPRPRL